jgi:lipoprotein-anchoring transpeptidase ErfK/SrfK
VSFLRLLLVTSTAALLTACSAGDVKEAVAPKDPITLSSNVQTKAKDVPVDTIVTATAEHGTITKALLATQDGKTDLEGRVTGDQWVASERLEPGTTYDLTVSGKGEDGKVDTLTRSFTTQQLTLDQQTFPAVAPLKGETVGVGMPVIVKFDLPVKNKALFERNMHVSTDPEIAEGSWSWLNDREAHFRPRTFWPAGTKVTVVLRLNSLPAGDGIYGQKDQVVPFTIGRSVVSTVDVGAHRLTVKIDGKTARTIPISAGDARHQTRRGTKIIMEKFSSVRMDAATTGVDSEDPDYYNIDDVKWAMRVTNSGEFLHAAPWQGSNQGRANVSHGCTGMSTANAAWYFSQSRRGDVVKFVDSPRSLEPQNGWTDWNVSWSDWVEGSALS